MSAMPVLFCRLVGSISEVDSRHLRLIYERGAVFNNATSRFWMNLYFEGGRLRLPCLKSLPPTWLESLMRKCRLSKR